jgi:hypothetical protein
VIAEEFQTLVTVAALALGFQRGDMGKGGGEQRRIGKFMPDTRLDRGGGCLGADLAALLLRPVAVRSGSRAFRRSSHD